MSTFTLASTFRHGVSIKQPSDTEFDFWFDYATSQPAEHAESGAMLQLISSLASGPLVEQAQHGPRDNAVIRLEGSAS